jgi:hypothetical protein
MTTSMADQQTHRCPTWCTDHNGSAHRTEADVIPTLSGEVPVRVFRYGVEGADERVQIGGEVFTLGQASDVARYLLRHVNRVQSPAVADALDVGDVTAAAEALLVQLATDR